MKKFILILLFLLVSPILFNVKVLAQCSEVLKYGIFDLSSSSKDEAFVKSIINALSQNDYGSASEFSNVAAGGGLDIGIVGLDADYDKTHSSSNSWSKSLASYLNSHAESYSKFKDYVVKANPNLIKAWSDCVVNQKGLIAWVTPSANLSEVILNIEARPKVAKDGGTTIDLTIHSSANVKMDKPLSMVIGAAPVKLLLNRSSCDGVNIIVNSSNADYSADAILVKGYCKPSTPDCNPTAITSSLVKRKGKKEWAMLLLDEELGYNVKKIIPNETLLNKLFVTSQMIEIEDCLWNLYKESGQFHPGTEVVIENSAGWSQTFCLKDPTTKTIRIITRRGLRLLHIPMDIKDYKKVRVVTSFAGDFPDYSLPQYDSPGLIQEKVDGSFGLAKVPYP